jgi:hypothetical protein
VGGCKKYFSSFFLCPTTVSDVRVDDFSIFSSFDFSTSLVIFSPKENNHQFIIYRAKKMRAKLIERKLFRIQRFSNPLLNQQQQQQQQQARDEEIM